MSSKWRMIVAGLAAVMAGVLVAAVLLGRGDDRDRIATVAVPELPSGDGDPAATGRQELGPYVVAARAFNYGEPGFAATRDKAQSKLWHHDGSWWAPLIDPFTEEVHIFELRDGAWADTGVFVDARAQSSADVVWTGRTLYIASRTSTGELLLQRYGYGPGRTWVPHSPTAERIAAGGGQSLTIAVDTQDRVWATWITAGRVNISHSEPGGTAWGAPVTPPGGENVQDDDATAVTAFGDRIGVLWSNQVEDAFYWSSRLDGDPPDLWSEQLAVSQGINIADGHINFAVAPSGDVYAAVKTSLGDDGEPLESTLIEVLHRDTDGVWSHSPAATVGSQMTRAQLAITADGRHLVLIATSPQSGGALYYKVAPADDPRFAPGRGSLLLAWENATINDPTTTGSMVDPAVPLVVLASDSSTAQYYYAELSIADLLSNLQGG
ncbi:hypothetical protein [Geodermatophilus ruber]|uniref:BNR repeat-containing family member n=1 Tax=Geodermatophilus ruber TaxID=504800 RepID=A0A1I4DEF8_9ACTN|nr:hypothetical protein [Geodermatophilus ruber]SFK92018.1 hypothetical protein SAMN04488085_104356 [Geodermatophilus ruber]